VKQATDRSALFAAASAISAASDLTTRWTATSLTSLYGRKRSFIRHFRFLCVRIALRSFWC